MRIPMSSSQRPERDSDSTGTSSPAEGPGDGSVQDRPQGLQERLRERAKRRLLGAQSRRHFLQVGLPWAAALLVGLVSVLYAGWSNDAYYAFIHLIAGRSWLAFMITP